MCAVSMVHDYHYKFPDIYWTPDTFDWYKKLAEQAREFDKATGQPHCEDPKKAELLKRVEQLLKDVKEQIVNS